MKTFFIASPMFWVSALNTVMSAIFKKFEVIISNSTDPKENLRLIEKYKVSQRTVSAASFFHDILTICRVVSLVDHPF